MKSPPYEPRQPYERGEPLELHEPNKPSEHALPEPPELEEAPEPLITHAEHARVRAHYARALPWLVHHFGETPVIGVSFPDGFSGAAVYHKDFRTLPDTIGRVLVSTSTGTHSYVRLDEHDVTWLCAAHFVVELHSWSPSFDDPDRAAFARLVLSPHGTTSEEQVFAAARVLRDDLAAEKLGALPVLDGFRGLTVWIPFADGPAYDRLAAWLHAFAAGAAARHPQTFTVAQLRADRGDRIYLGTKSNHPGMCSLLPYALRGTPALEVSLPVAWDDLGKIRNGEVTAGRFGEYMKLFGDVFERERAKIGVQTFGARVPAGVPHARRAALLAAPEPTPRNYIIAAALAVLADGDAHDAQSILATGLERGLLPASTTRKYVYTALHEYVVRSLGAGKTPELVQVEGTATFRLNRPADAWPAIALPPPPRWLDDATVSELEKRLRATATGADAAAFEVAACDAFAALGFRATHVGGNGAPDGVLVAPLGVAGYRSVLECKTAAAGGVVSNPRPEEAAKFRAGADATSSILLGPAFANDASLDDELRTHAVALWTVDDLATALALQLGPDELRPLLAPGRAEFALRDLGWEREHGRRKRIAVIADRLARAAWQAQMMLAGEVGAAQSPALGEDTLFVLIDEALAAEGIADGAHLDEAREAIVQLEVAGRLRRQDSAYIVRQPPPPRVV